MSQYIVFLSMDDREILTGTPVNDISAASELIMQEIASNKLLYKREKVTVLKVYKLCETTMVDIEVPIMSKKIIIKE